MATKETATTPRCGQILGGDQAAEADGAQAPAAAEPEEPKFLAFAGSGRRLDGKAASESRPVAVPLPGSSSGYKELNLLDRPSPTLLNKTLRI